MNKKSQDNDWGWLIGLGIGIAVIAIMIALVKLTWPFWSRLMEGSSIASIGDKFMKP
jgi:hypothetical protein